MRDLCSCGSASPWKSRRERNVIVKSSNSDAEAAMTRAKRGGSGGLLHGNQDKARTIQVAGFHRQLASSDSLPLSPFLPFSWTLLLRESICLFFSSSVCLSPYRLPRQHFLSWGILIPSLAFLFLFRRSALYTKWKH